MCDSNTVPAATGDRPDRPRGVAGSRPWLVRRRPELAGTRPELARSRPDLARSENSPTPAPLSDPFGGHERPAGH